MNVTSDKKTATGPCSDKPQEIGRYDWTPNQLAFNPHYEPANTIGSTQDKP